MYKFNDAIESMGVENILIWHTLKHRDKSSKNGENR